MTVRPHMKKVKSKDTAPEIQVRRLLCQSGFKGYRLHKKLLPGRPDISFTRIRKAIFVHGCFWHGHNCRAGRNQPKSNTDYWIPKIERNRVRDIKHINELKTLGWKTLIVWECELKNTKKVTKALENFLGA